MQLDFSQIKKVVEALKIGYSTTPELDPIVLFSVGKPISDLGGLGSDRSQIYFKVIMTVNNIGKSADLVQAVLDDKPENEIIQRLLIPILKSVDPEPGVPPHEHLLTQGVAFANRRTLRDSVNGLVSNVAQTALVLRGPSLSGTSYSKRLVHHVAKANSIKPINIDFGLPMDASLLGVTEAIKTDMKVTEPLPVVDLPGNTHLASRLVRWLCAQAEGSTQTYWIVFDNSNRATVPPTTKEMIVHFIRYLSGAAISKLKVVVLGFDIEIAVGAPQVQEVRLDAIGRPEIREFLEQFKQRHSVIPGFATVDEAADALTDGIDINSPSRQTLSKVTDQLNKLLSEVL